MLKIRFITSKSTGMATVMKKISATQLNAENPENILKRLFERLKRPN